MKSKQDVACHESATSHSTAAPAKETEGLQVKGSLPTWGMWERLVPDMIKDETSSQRILREIHFRRYKTAARYVRGKSVLDIACGTGYGTRMLKEAGARAVVGVDIYAQAVQYAKQHYETPGIEFICTNAEQFEWPERFDVVVSFETIEHLQDPGKFLERIRSLLVPGGDFLLSVPLGETRHMDPYHLHVFSQKQVFDLFEKAGFWVDLYRCDEWFMSRSELLRSGQFYPETKPSLRELLFTKRGQMALRDFVFHGGFHMPQLLVVARSQDSQC